MDAFWDESAPAENDADGETSGAGSVEVTATQSLGQPFFWRICEGVLYAEAHVGVGIRPPLLTEWEAARAREFHSPRRRARWLAARTVAKALVRERLDLQGVVEIREGLDGEPLVYRDGLPLTDIWLSIVSRADRIACVIADRPVALDLQRIDASTTELVQRMVRRGELRGMRRSFPVPEMTAAVAWAIKSAALKVTRTPDGEMRDVRVKPDFAVETTDTHLHTLAVRVLEDVAIAVVGRPLLTEQLVTRVVLDDSVELSPTSPARAAVDRSVARARRLADARMRWQGLRFGTNPGVSPA